MKILEEYTIGDNISVRVCGYQQKDGAWGGHAGVTFDMAAYVEDRKVYPKDKTYSTNDELVDAIKETVSTHIS